MTANKPPDRALALSEDLRAAFKLVIREMRRDADRQDAGLSLIQTMLMAAIDEHPSIGVAELARMQQVRSPTISGQIKTLEAAGLVERTAPSQEDGRRSGLRLTRSGRTTLGKLRAQRLDWLAQRIARLSPAQMDALAAAIEPLTLIGTP